VIVRYFAAEERRNAPALSRPVAIMPFSSFA
jgi:hypothetical protein